MRWESVLEVIHTTDGLAFSARKCTKSYIETARTKRLCPQAAVQVEIGMPPVAAGVGVHANADDHCHLLKAGVGAAIAAVVTTLRHVLVLERNIIHCQEDVALIHARRIAEGLALTLPHPDNQKLPYFMYALQSLLCPSQHHSMACQFRPHGHLSGLDHGLLHLHHHLFPSTLSHLG